ncbi:hypothetical protein TNCV_4547371 [Trichonephila clavipes]|nr:hypothetical protein TNCV_4547371 [Trichonephila clavipes]
MKTKDDEIIIQLLNDENTERLMQEREEMRHDAKNKDRQLHDRYEVEKVGQHEGPHLTSTAVDFMKMWSIADA